MENLNDAKNLQNIIYVTKKKFKSQENIKLLNIRTKEVEQNCEMMHKIFLNNKQIESEFLENLKQSKKLSDQEHQEQSNRVEKFFKFGSQFIDFAKNMFGQMKEKQYNYQIQIDDMIEKLQVIKNPLDFQIFEMSQNSASNIEQILKQNFQWKSLCDHKEQLIQNLKLKMDKMKNQYTQRNFQFVYNNFYYQKLIAQQDQFIKYFDRKTKTLQEMSKDQNNFQQIIDTINGIKQYQLDISQKTTDKAQIIMNKIQDKIKKKIKSIFELKKQLKEKIKEQKGYKENLILVDLDLKYMGLQNQDQLKKEKKLFVELKISEKQHYQSQIDNEQIEIDYLQNKLHKKQNYLKKIIDVNSKDLKYKRSKLRREIKNIEIISKKIKEKLDVFQNLQQKIKQQPYMKLDKEFNQTKFLQNQICKIIENKKPDISIYNPGYIFKDRSEETQPFTQIFKNVLLDFLQQNVIKVDQQKLKEALVAKMPQIKQQIKKLQTLTKNEQNKKLSKLNQQNSQIKQILIANQKDQQELRRDYQELLQKFQSDLDEQTQKIDLQKILQQLKIQEDIIQNIKNQDNSKQVTINKIQKESKRYQKKYKDWKRKFLQLSQKIEEIGEIEKLQLQDKIDYLINYVKQYEKVIDDLKKRLDQKEQLQQSNNFNDLEEFVQELEENTDFQAELEQSLQFGGAIQSIGFNQVENIYADVLNLFNDQFEKKIRIINADIHSTELRVITQVKKLQSLGDYIKSKIHIYQLICKHLGLQQSSINFSNYKDKLSRACLKLSGSDNDKFKLQKMKTIQKSFLNKLTDALKPLNPQFFNQQMTQQLVLSYLDDFISNYLNLQGSLNNMQQKFTTQVNQLQESLQNKEGLIQKAKLQKRQLSTKLIKLQKKYNQHSKPELILSEILDEDDLIELDDL